LKRRNESARRCLIAHGGEDEQWLEDLFARAQVSRRGPVPDLLAGRREEES
jgi:hypothetical protein